ncbi:MAG: dihydroorotase [Acidiferrobacterales bacterium]|nr:dihydroorotase [Acidiferrobacterales bacterium]
MKDCDLIVRDGLVAAHDGTIAQADVACTDGRIVSIAPSLKLACNIEISAQGLLVLPGVIDAQVHFRDPGNTHKEDLASGSRAAVRGGVTSFLEMPNTNPPTINQQELDKKLARAAQVCVANYGFFIGATPDNLDDINSAGPVCGIKIFMGSSTGTLLVHAESDLERIFAGGSRLIAVHAEDEERLRSRMQAFLGDGTQPIDVAVHSQIRDDESALLATRRAVELSRKFNRRLHVLHLTSAVEVDYLRDNKTDLISVECTPNHLFLTENDYAQLGSFAQMNPPLRTIRDQQALWAGLKDGTIDFIATDHAPHTKDEKAKAYPESPSGMPGVETSLPLILTAWKDGHCTLEQLLKWLCRGPAEIYGMVGKGRLEPGFDADLTIVDIDHYRTVRDDDMLTKVRWSPFRGRKLTGWPLWTIVGGKIAYADNTIQEGVRGSPVRFG